MDEEETKRKAEEEAKESPEQKGEGDNDKGDKYETTPIIERARQEREKLEAANTKKEELLNREEKIIAKRELGGGSEAGQTQEKPKEETPVEYAERVMKNE